MASPGWLVAFVDWNFLYFSGALFAACLVLPLLASRFQTPPDPGRIEGLTLASVDRAALRSTWNGFDVAATIIVLGVVAGIYLYFSFWIG